MDASYYTSACWMSLITLGSLLMLKLRKVQYKKRLLFWLDLVGKFYEIIRFGPQSGLVRNFLSGRRSGSCLMFITKTPFPDLEVKIPTFSGQCWLLVSNGQWSGHPVKCYSKIVAFLPIHAILWREAWRSRKK